MTGHMADEIVDRRSKERRRAQEHLNWWRKRVICAFFLLVLANIGGFYYTYSIGNDRVRDAKNQTALVAREAKDRAASLKQEQLDRAYALCIRGNEFRDITYHAFVNAISAAIPITGDPIKNSERIATIQRVKGSILPIRRSKRLCPNPYKNRHR